MVLVEETHASGIGDVAIAPGVVTPTRSRAWHADQTRLIAADTSVELVELGPHVFVSPGDVGRIAPTVLFVAVGEGRLLGDAGGHRFEVLAGQALLVDTRLPIRSRATHDLKVLRVVVSHRQLPRRLFREPPSAASVVADSPVMRASLAAASTLLRRSTVAGVADDDRAIAQMLAGLQLGLLGDASRQSRSSTGIRGRAARRQEIDAYIDEHLGEVSLSAVTVGQALGLSVRSVHNAFGGASDTVGAAIRRRRLERLLQHLNEIATRPDLADLAAEFGYRDAPHLLRVFRATTGIEFPTWWNHNRPLGGP